MKHTKVIGIVGGMGPEAGIALFNKISERFDGKTDQEHPSILLFSEPVNIPDRTRFLKKEIDINPALEIFKIIKKLEACGATDIAMPCNTSHAPKIYNHIIKQMKENGCKSTLFHLPKETVNYLVTSAPLVKKVGLLATIGTYSSQFYQKLLLEKGIVTIDLSSKMQKHIHQIFYDSKEWLKAKWGPPSANIRVRIDDVIVQMKEQGADAIILGCTELSKVDFNEISKDIIIIDSVTALANALHVAYN